MNSNLKNNYFSKIKNSVFNNQNFSLNTETPKINIFNQIKQNIAKKLTLKKIQNSIKITKKGLNNFISLRNTPVCEGNAVLSSLETEEIDGIDENDKRNLNYSVKHLNLFDKNTSQNIEIINDKPKIYDFGEDLINEQKLEKFIKLKISKSIERKSYIKHDHLFSNRLETEKKKMGKFQEESSGFQSNIMKTMSSSSLNETNWFNKQSKSKLMLKKFLFNDQNNLNLNLNLNNNNNYNKPILTQTYFEPNSRLHSAEQHNSFNNNYKYDFYKHLLDKKKRNLILRSASSRRIKSYKTNEMKKYEIFIQNKSVKII